MSAPSPAAARRAPTMTLWRLELARLARTHRWVLLLGVYGLFAVVGPLTARYLDEIVRRFGEGVQITTPEPTPADGIAQFVSNASQLGLLAVVVVAAAALTLDAKPELAAFLRTKVDRPGWLVVPPYVVTVAAAAAALVVSTAIAAGLTAALIGAPPVGPLLVGTLYGIVYLAFAVAVVAAVAGHTRGQAATVFGALGVLLLFPIVGVLQPVRPWLPSELLAAVAALVDGASAGDHLRSLAVTVVATALLLAWAARRREQREL